MNLRNKLAFFIALNNYVELITRGTSPLSLPKAIANSLSYVKAFGGTEQRNLPDGYIERQFIYMMDGSYLLTDIVPTYDGRIEMDFQTTTVSSGVKTYIGGRTASHPAGLRFGTDSSNRLTLGAFDYSYTTSTSPSNNTRYKFVYNNQRVSLTSNGTTIFDVTSTGTSATGAELAINALNNNGTIVSGNAEIYLYSFKAWNGQGELVMDLVPAIQKGTVPVVGFYDTVSGTFKTATAGTFAAGGEAVPTPDAPVDIVSNNGVLKARHQSGLPLGYTLLDYIKADTNIPLGFYTNQNSEIEAKWYKDGAGSQYAYWANSGSALTNNTTAYATDGGGNWRFGNQTIPITAPLNIDVISIQNKNGVWFNNVQKGAYTDVNDFTGDEEFKALGNPSAGYDPIVRLSYIKRRQNGVLLGYYVPCVAPDNSIGLYDLIGGVFYTNADATITVGTAVSDPVEIYTDGTVETIKAHGKNLFDVSANPLEQGGIASNDGQDTASSYYQRVRTNGYIPVKPNTTYTASVKDLQIYYLEYAQDTTYTNRHASGFADNSVIFTTGANTYFVRLQFRKSGNADIAPSEVTNVQLEPGSTATEYQPYFDGGTATAEILLKVGDYQDVQSIIDGVVTRNIGVKVLDGTENWQNISGYFNLSKTYLGSDSTVMPSNSHNIICSHFETKDGTFTDGIGIGGSYVNFKYDSITTVLADWKTWLATQYAAGTPVTVIYPLATPTTESVAGQTLQVTDGDNVLEITQASLNGLELEAKYKKRK